MFVDLTPENLADETLCCIVRMKKAHPGVEAKRQRLAERLKEGHVFRKLEGRATVFMEYAPLEKAWVPILGENYLYIYCLWTEGENRGKGYGKALLESCLADARAQGRYAGGGQAEGMADRSVVFSGISALKRWTLPQTVTNCWLFPLTEPIPGSRPTYLKWKLKNGS